MGENKQKGAGKELLIESLVEGRRMEAYAEHRSKEMHVCWMCEEIIYRKKPIKQVGDKWVCLDCLRALKESLDTIDEWEKEIAFGERMKQQVARDLKIEKT